MKKTKEILSSEKGWEIKDRHYYLTGNKSPLTLTIPSKHTKKHALLFYDEQKGMQRELALCNKSILCFCR